MSQRFKIRERTSEQAIFFLTLEMSDEDIHKLNKRSARHIPITVHSTVNNTVFGTVTPLSGILAQDGQSGWMRFKVIYDSSKIGQTTFLELFMNELGCLLDFGWMV